MHRRAFQPQFPAGRVMPLLAERWPQVTASLARSASHLGEAQQLLEELAEMDLLATRGVCAFPWLPLPSLDLSAVTAQAMRVQRNLLRWLAPLSRMPDSDWVGWCDLRDAATDAAPIWKLTDGELHVPMVFGGSVVSGCGRSIPRSSLRLVFQDRLNFPAMVMCIYRASYR